jgi:hypothetical protein
VTTIPISQRRCQRIPTGTPQALLHSSDRRRCGPLHGQVGAFVARRCLAAPASLSAGAALFLAPPAQAGLLLPLAQGPSVTSSQLGIWVMCLLAVLTLVNSIVSIASYYRRQPPLEVEFMRREDAHAQMSPIFLPRQEADERLSRLSTKIDAVRIELREEVAGLRRDSNDHARNVQTKFDALIEKIGELRGRPRHDS